MSLPVALEELAQAAKPKSAHSAPELPPSLLTKASKLRDDGGIQMINSMFTQLPELYLENKSALDEVVLLQLQLDFETLAFLTTHVNSSFYPFLKIFSQN